MKGEAIRQRLARVEWRELDLRDAAHWPPLVQWLCCLLLVVALASLSLYYLARPDMQALTMAQREEAELLSRYRHQLDRVASLPQQREQLARHQEALSWLAGAFPDSSGMAALIDAIGRAAQQSGVKLANVELQPVIERPPLVVHPVSLKISGAFHDLGRFVADISTLERLVTWHELRMVESDAGVRLSLQARAYQFVASGEEGGE
ncbi:type 4a pilus biogenesis protein PilO [Halomonas sabkhae]|uniref:type 4a pilus biogenesis protein PilO n=1 Tax=Halomonas sabkhae TaxID=626223 RepID=UPI0025B2A23A|nr:type 4a pilus biogenesis protein PilO [Halomonas sabkhae]MDN3524010.1 type 4a pilus biogenesis protein PilO [Halomonas sabkhae]